jgi:uncharacterized protein (UPF0548 family)
VFAFESAVRVTTLTEESSTEVRALGFQYATLEGHPEMGIAGFTIRHSMGDPGRLEFTIESWSQPGHWMSQMAGPFSRWMQVRSTQQALEHFKQALSQRL